MNYEKELAENSTAQKITAKQLINMIKSPDVNQLKYSGDETTIIIRDYIVQDENIIFSESLTVKYRLTFENCFFVCDKGLFIIGMVCENFLTFENCYFTRGIYLEDGTFKKELLLKSIHLENIHLGGGIYEEIKLSAFDVQSFWISDAKFKKLDLETYVGGNDFGDLTIMCSQPDELGDIIIANKKFDRISIYGTNKDKRFDFKNIECDFLSIINFINAGSLNFFGVKPRKLHNEERYFQIVNSSLEKVQFFRVYFSQYKEFIILDSLIADAIFINCKWTNNIRALKGPNFGNYQESIRNGRKITKDEFNTIKESYRQLKISMNKQGDKIYEGKFYAEEMNYYNKLLDWTCPLGNQFWEKVILHWSRIFSNYGQSFIRPFLFLLIGHFLLFSLAVCLNGLLPLHYSYSNPTSEGFREAFEKFFIYINPLRRLEMSLTGYLVVIDIFMRVWSSYMLYNIIRATRRFIS
ncbi:hypothetical protein [Pinibacter aurantiacus]|uniref:Pentapeptide repeat-containing protein n=1 Tax=Pinibacter aurantiacus TaxID=2851599 RepID=A0A9E2S9H7_9BACT|nr:hypothetical protein [Pinibacter aurantiacus]MBV4357358.1 hypothetical protein [Pinibacter aurantiacus]